MNINTRNKLQNIQKQTLQNTTNIDKLSLYKIDFNQLNFHKIQNEVIVYSQPYNRNDEIYLTIPFNNLSENYLHWIFPYSILEKLNGEVCKTNYNLKYSWHQYQNQYILFLDYVNIYDITINSGRLIVKLNILNPRLYKNLSTLKIS